VSQEHQLIAEEVKVFEIKKSRISRVWYCLTTLAKKWVLTLAKVTNDSTDVLKTGISKVMEPHGIVQCATEI